MNRMHSNQTGQPWALALALAGLMSFPARGAEESGSADRGAAGRSAARPDLVRFRNGDLLYGKLLTIQTETGLRWKHADVTEPIAFKLDNVLELQVRETLPTDAT